MVKTRKPQASYDEMIENIAVATAARISQNTRLEDSIRNALDTIAEYCTWMCRVGIEIAG